MKVNYTIKNFNRLTFNKCDYYFEVLFYPFLIIYFKYQHLIILDIKHLISL